jgi:hypothetical protein
MKRKEMCSDRHVLGCDEVSLLIARACAAGGFRKEKKVLWVAGRKESKAAEKEL